MLRDGEAQAESARPAALPHLPPEAPRAEEQTGSANAALQLLALLQREGRFMDFVQQELASFSDADIGAAARVVHEGWPARDPRARRGSSACARKQRARR